MARMPRGYLADGIYHVTTRSAGPSPIFTNDIECTYVCNTLAKVIVRSGWDCLCFCIMSTHYHLLLSVPEESLKRGMQALNWAYARWFNKQRGRWGHVFGDRYFCKPVTSDGQLLATVRYIARNPVRAGLCELPEDWVWSSYRGLIDAAAPFPFVADDAVRRYFGPEPGEAAVQIRQMISG